MPLNTVTFTSSTTWTVPNGVYLINELFLVGGGGGGGYNCGGGGGGGGLTFSSNLQVSPSTGVAVTIGPGGGGATTYTTGASGGGSAFGPITAAGGAGGGSYNFTSYISGNDSQGGNSGSNSVFASAFTGGFGLWRGIQSPGDGGFRVTAGGGAGNSQNGSSSGDYPGTGGNGYLLPWNSTYYGGGGGGGAYRYTTIGNIGIATAPGGLGGGGSGGSSTSANGQTASANTGGGGGGGGNGSGVGNGGTGGSGIVIIRYWDPTYKITATPGEAETNSITLTLRTTGVTNGAVVPFTVSGVGVSAADFTPASTSGNFTVSSSDGGFNGVATTTITLASDSATEGNEEVTVSLVNGLATCSFLIGDFSRAAPASITDTTIQIQNYNNIRDKIVAVLGSGSSNSGYGQSIYSSAVSLGQKIGISEWNRLKFDIINAWTHIYGTTPGLVTILENDIIRAGVSAYPFVQYDSYANAITAARGKRPAVGQFITVSKGSQRRVGSFVNQLNCIISVSFGSAAAARYFFNSGGEIRIQSIFAGSSGTSQNNSWQSVLSTAGQQAFGGFIPVQGTGTLDGKNFYRCTTTFREWYRAQSTNSYAANNYILSARTPAVANNSGGTASTLELYVQLFDDHTGISAGPDAVDGILDVFVETLEATGTMQPSGAGLGNFTVASPSISFGTITGS
jgi:hypothetical protein